MHRTRNAAYGQPYRGFESLPLRQPLCLGARYLKGNFLGTQGHPTSNVAVIVSRPPGAIDPTATAKTFPVIRAEAHESALHYIDTASSRAKITALSAKLELQKIAIVGLDGTGSYVLDLIAKTPLLEIHMFNGDAFSQH